VARKMAVPRAVADQRREASADKARPRQTRQRADPARAEPFAAAVSTITGRRSACYTDPIGFDRYTVDRLLCNCSGGTRTTLLRAFKSGDQFVAARVPVDALPVIVLLASFLRLYGAELVDDFDALIERYFNRITEC